MDYMPQAAEKLTWKTWLASEPSLVLGSTKNQNIFRSIGKWIRVTHPNEEYVVSKMQRGLLGIVPPFGCKEEPEATTYSLF